MYLETRIDCHCEEALFADEAIALLFAGEHCSIGLLFAVAEIASLRSQ